MRRVRNRLFLACLAHCSIRMRARVGVNMRVRMRVMSYFWPAAPTAAYHSGCCCSRCCPRRQSPTRCAGCPWRSCHL
eukprot:scaffold96594_cov36-Phaeocystis_antarctica.AAC.1